MAHTLRATDERLTRVAGIDFATAKCMAHTLRANGSVNEGQVAHRANASSQGTLNPLDVTRARLEPSNSGKITGVVRPPGPGSRTATAQTI